MVQGKDQSYAFTYAFDLYQNQWRNGVCALLPYTLSLWRPPCKFKWR